MKIKSNIHIKSFLLIGLVCLAITSKAQEQEKTSDIRLSVSGEMGFGDKTGFVSDDGNAEMKSLQNNNLMLTIEGVFARSRKMESSILLGFGYSFMTFKADYASPMYSITTNQDVDGDTYVRQYNNLTLSQEAKGGSFMVSLAFRERLKVRKGFNLYGDLGVNGMISPSLNLEKSDGLTKVSGRYSQYEDITFDDEWGYNGFGYEDLAKANVIKKVGVNSFVPIAFVRLGAELEISKGCNLSFGATYQKGLNNLIKYDNGNGTLTPSNAIVFNTIDGMKSTENVRSIMSTYNKSKFSGFMFNVGLSVCF